MVQVPINPLEKSQQPSNNNKNTDNQYYYTNNDQQFQQTDIYSYDSHYVQIGQPMTENPRKPPNYSVNRVVVVEQVLPNTANGQLYSTYIQCPVCHYKVRTHTKHKIGVQTILCSIIILLIFWPLFFLPCLIVSCQDTDHYCDNCGSYVGTSKYSIC
ncbi:hypothetical protein PPERSA_02050 [Pseudocohnilembus persalinus]|uniref:LITAF domain-containing protein n=1 Tax=Pseudocohnilembus persalinus TaxID=266149 RepID=A0A0V0QFA9_PSEPJ|nr:hypothetical protein PPERSA_02050 [Pseudocohnilembus persalinus]|eukprot:KRX00871.1 hypothetical protein PPERSA_02050 [Pseudocohnilembus persalinus]